MKTLQELINLIGRTDGKNDLKVIEQWFIINDKESDGINLMNTLAKSKVEKLECIVDRTSLYQGLAQGLCENYGTEIGGQLHDIMLLFLLGYDIENEYPHHFDWLKFTIPKLKQTVPFCVPFRVWMEGKGIEFGEKINAK